MGRVPPLGSGRQFKLRLAVCNLIADAESDSVAVSRIDVVRSD